MSELNLQYAHGGLFRRLDADDEAYFEKRGREDYEKSAAKRPPDEFVLNPVHHPAYRRGVALAAIDQAAGELELVGKPS